MIRSIIVIKLPTACHSRLLPLLVCFFSFFASNAQIVPIGSLPDQTARTMQLLGKTDSSISFCARPFMSFPQHQMLANYALPCVNGDGVAGKAIAFAKGKKDSFYVLPVTFTQQYNTHHPYGWNDGAMIAAKGYQMFARAGVYYKRGILDIQLQPEFVFAVNNAYQHSTLYGEDVRGMYAKVFAGQSAVSLSLGNVSIGASTANLWWGPGIRSSLLMTNNAPGFPHLFFKTRKPIKTAIGSFEWQLIGSWLSSDSSITFENSHLRKKDPSKVNDTRYMNGLVLSYQPKWVPGLFVGFTRSIQTYAATNLGAPKNAFERYLPVIALAVQKKDVKDEDSLSRDQLASFFLRWVFPKANMEVYFEYGFNDYGVNIRDYLLGTSHSAAHIVGIRKIVPQGESKRIEFGLELTQMSQSPDWVVRNAGNWYEHEQIVEGYTYQNQIMGAGAGFGANVISVDATWIKGGKRLGFVLERVERDPQPHPVKWVDIGLGVLPQWKYRQYLISGIFQVIKSRNYLWETGRTPINIHTQLSVQYFF